MAPSHRRPPGAPGALDAPTVLTPEVVSHRKPARRFQVIGIFVLVLGAIAGAYAGFGRDSAPATPLSVDLASIPVDNITDEMATSRALVKAKAEAAAAAEAERVRKANEVAARNQEAASRSQERTAAPPVPGSCNEFTGNRALGCAILLEIGFGLDQMGCLNTLWTHESGWNERAMNRSSGAYGIPQALPASKMAIFGADYQTNPVPQIRWGLDYIKSRYGTPCGAWSYWQSHNWY
jgi:hypothetical protein